MTQMNVFNPIFHEMVNNIAPWHSFIGGPYFPEKPLYSRDKSFCDVNNVAINYDDKNKLQSIIAHSSLGDNASVEFELIEELTQKIMLCHFKKNSKTELTLAEWFDGQKLYLTFRKPNYAEFDVDIIVIPVNGKIYEFDIEVKFNNKLFKENIKAKALDVPHIALDFAKEISSLQSDLTVAALDSKFIGIITMEAYKMFYQENRDITGHIVNLVAGIIGHIAFACVGGIIIHLISMLLIPEELH